MIQLVQQHTPALYLYLLESTRDLEVVTHLVNIPDYGDQVQVLYAEQFEKIDFSDLIDLILQIMRRYNVRDANSVLA